MTWGRCKHPEHAQLPAHELQGMSCLAVGCGGAWRDCVGAFGFRFKTGCPACGGRYWIASTITTATISRLVQ